MITRIGILSDTHNTWDPRFAEHFASCDEIWHAGDFGDISVLEQLRKVAKVYGVYGNIDGVDIRSECPQEQLFTSGGATVLMRHIVGTPGHYRPGIATRLRATRPNILVAGHSHILRVEFDRTFDTLYINPGAAGTYGQQTVRTLVRMAIENGIPKDLEVIELR